MTDGGVCRENVQADDVHERLTATEEGEALEA